MDLDASHRIWIVLRSGERVGVFVNSDRDLNGRFLSKREAEYRRQRITRLAEPFIRKYTDIGPLIGD